MLIKQQHFFFFLIIWALTSAADFWFWSIHGNPLFGCYMACHGLVMAYGITLICQLFRGFTAKIVEGILIILGIINMIADATVHSIMHFGFTQDMVAIILGTNSSEASEFLPMYINAEVITFIIVVLSIVFCLWFFRKKYSTHIREWLQMALLGICLLSAGIIIIRKSNNWEGVFLYKIKTFLSYETPVDLQQYRSNPSVSINGIQPENFILIIGESLSRNHCSIYGYSKPTQPKLGAMADDGSLIVFKDAESPFPNTLESFKRIMSSFDGKFDEEEWYKNKIFMADAMKAAGYSTFWISNQSSAGLYDNIVTKFARLTDSTIWVGTKGMGISKHDLDENLLPEIEKVKEKSGKKFIIIHMMGSHEEFQSRYPLDYSRFSETDYPTKPKEQREMLAAYDNSILYNDFVVSSIIHMFEDGNNIIIYFPDHGLDIYDTDTNYAGHARISIPESFKIGIQIPFIIYPSKDYKATFPHFITNLENYAVLPYCTSNILYTILELSNCTLHPN